MHTTNLSRDSKYVGLLLRRLHLCVLTVYFDVFTVCVFPCYSLRLRGLICVHSLSKMPFSAHGAARHRAIATMLGLESSAGNFGQAFHSDTAAAAVAAEYGYSEGLM